MALKLEQVVLESTVQPFVIVPLVVWSVWLVSLFAKVESSWSKGSCELVQAPLVAIRLLAQQKHNRTHHTFFASDASEEHDVVVDEFLPVALEPRLVR